LQFTTANAHPAGYTVSSASGGLQEAIIAARFTPTNPTGTSQAGKVTVPPGELKSDGQISAWGPYNDQNLAGRFTTQTFTLPRLGKVENYFLRQYDASSPPRYSRFTAALHVDYPF
jgi:hypothetical protein